MTQPKQPPVFTISNRHALGANQPPCIDGDEPNTYHSYFENIHGDQSLFIHHRDTGETLIHSGDAEWTAFPVVKGKVQGLVLSTDEETWLFACLHASGAGK